MNRRLLMLSVLSAWASRSPSSASAASGASPAASSALSGDTCDHHHPHHHCAKIRRCSFFVSQTASSRRSARPKSHREHFLTSCRIPRGGSSSSVPEEKERRPDDEDAKAHDHQTPTTDLDDRNSFHQHHGLQDDEAFDENLPPEMASFDGTANVESSSHREPQIETVVVPERDEHVLMVSSSSSSSSSSSAPASPSTDQDGAAGAHTTPKTEAIQADDAPANRVEIDLTASQRSLVLAEEDRPADPPAIQVVTPPPVPAVEAISLPRDAPFAQSSSPATAKASTTAAFVKRSPIRHPKTSESSSSRVIRPQRHGEPRHGKGTPPPAAAAEVAPERNSAPTSSAFRTLFGPLALLAGGVSAVLRNPFCLCYLCALLGTSVGFFQFLYFSTVGYAWGVALPVMAAMLQQKRATIPSLLVVLWAIRLSVFLLWREYVNWPALHAHMQWVSAPPFPTQVLGWLVYSALYWAVASPCWWSLLPPPPHTNAADGTPTDLPAPPSPPSANPLAVALQVAGLVLETAADLQKSNFKATHRREWCHVGAWKYSTHPNYVGEGLFWLGTHLSGFTALRQRHRSAASRASQLVASGIGLSFVASILRGAVLHLHDAQGRKYGHDPLFQAFRDHYGLLGYKFWNDFAHRRALQAAVPSMATETSEDGAAATDATQQ